MEQDLEGMQVGELLKKVSCRMMSPVQKELMSINNRYDMIGMRLNDRQNDLDNMRDELRKLSESMKNIYQALEKAERSVPRDIIPATKEEADKFNKHIKVVLDELSEKQPSLDNLKSQIIDIIKKKPNAPGADILTEQLDSLLERFKELQGRLKDKLKYMDRIKDFLDNHDSLNNWLSSKDKMMAVLGPIASDPRMAQMQAQQVMVLRDEFHGQEPKLNGLNELGDSIIAASEPNSPASRKINDKLDTINNKWTELIGQLDSRDSSLNAASDASKDFYDNYNKLQDKLQKLGDDFDEAMANGLDPAQQLNVMQALEDGLDGVRHPLINLEGLGEHLMSILSDPSSKSDIKSKIGQLNKMYNNLERKLGNKRSEIEASLKDQEEFGNSCHDIQDWLADQIANLKDQLLVSAR
ncbi:Microtubule-actin cross-linking factor 1, isoforms 1/2/3/5 [Armadillidium vulgare]|nr:Microtubule-actin cross-linking factor 1, isoforms 1/2/3/5 [Armadillidium vulgare]